LTKRFIGTTPETGLTTDDLFDRARDSSGAVLGLMVDGQPKAGFDTPSKKLEFFSDTLSNWGWS
jgi:hypothetical protein